MGELERMGQEGMGQERGEEKRSKLREDKFETNFLTSWKFGIGFMIIKLERKQEKKKIFWFWSTTWKLTAEDLVFVEQ